MIERLVEYLANAVWQLPLLAAGAWWLLRSVRFGPRAQYRVWIAVLGMGLLLPLERVAPVTVQAPKEVAARSVGSAAVLAHVRTERSAFAADTPREKVKPDGSRMGLMRSLVRRRSLRVSEKAARGIAVVYLTTLLIALLRILLACGAAWRLVRESQEMVLSDQARELVEECGHRLGVRPPRVAESEAVSSPAVVGMVAPVLLLPEAFHRYTEDEMRTALLHELAHIRRSDYAANLLCEMAALPLAWHPVTYAVQGRIRNTREMACDAMAAREMQSPVVYARSLVTLASSRFGGMDPTGFMAAGLFTNNNLEERVMQLTETKQAMVVRARAVRMMSAVTAMAAVVALATMVHVTPALAQAPEAAPNPQAAPSTSGPQNGPATVGPQGAPETAGPAGAPAAIEQNAPAVGVSAPPADEEILRTASVQDEKSADEPLAMAHGEHATVKPQEGAFIHRWTAADGKPFEVLTRKAAEPTPEEKKRFEEEFKKQSADLDQLKVQELKLDSVKELKDLDEVKLQQQLAKLQSPELKMQLKLQMDTLQLHMGDLKINDAELQKQLGKLNSEDMQKRMAALQKQLAESGLQSADAQKQLEKLNSEDWKKQMADLDRQLATLTKQEIQSQVKDEVEKQLKEAQKHLDEAREEIEKDRARAAEHPDAPCTEPCSAQPQ